jgi:hypothetical protein
MEMVQRENLLKNVQKFAIMRDGTLTKSWVRRRKAAQKMIEGRLIAVSQQKQGGLLVVHGWK